MKKLAVFILAVGMLGTFSGCHLRHDMLPATCTEPSTCSVCGKTEGEALGHTEAVDEAVEPTCTETGLTEGSHCEVCGEVLVPQETIEALGHTEVIDEAVEPTCTESGLTEGSHCEVCGEVLVPQETVEAPGHDWEEASFSKPKTCRVCGAEEGEPLGTELFIRALNPPLPDEEITEAAAKLIEDASGDEADAAAEPSDAAGGPAEDAADSGAADVSLHKDIRVSGHSNGLGEADDFLDNSSFEMITDIEKDKAVFSAETVINGSKPVHILAAGDEEGVGLTLPGITEEYYYVTWDTLREMLGSSAQSLLPEDAAAAAAQDTAARLEELFRDEEIRNLIQKYERILFSVVTVHNTKETRMDYLLPSLGKTQNCLVLEIHPDAGDWRVMLRELLTTAVKDTVLKDKVIIPLAEILYASDDTMSWYYDSPEAYADDMAEGLLQSLSDALENVDPVAEALAAYSMTVAYDSGRVYALGIYDESDQGLFYESYGTPETEREDVLVVRADGSENRLAYNTISISGSRAAGRLSLNDEEIVLGYTLGKDDNEKPYFDIRLSSSEFVFNIALENEEQTSRLKALVDTSEGDAQLEIDVSDTEERLTVPEEKTILKTEDDFSNALETISEDIRQAELYGHTWQEATCTSPRTCEVCGETEGEPLGHDWTEADCTKPRTCRRCGETEGEPLGHDWEEKNEKGGRVCRRCGKNEKTLFDNLGPLSQVMEGLLTGSV